MPDTQKPKNAASSAERQAKWKAKQEKDGRKRREYWLTESEHTKVATYINALALTSVVVKETYNALTNKNRLRE